MRKFFAVAAILLASTAANAGETYTFDVGGRTIHIDPDRGSVSIPGLYESGPKRIKRSRDADDDDDIPVRTKPSRAKAEPQAAPVQQVPAPESSPAVPPSASAKLAPETTTSPASDVPPQRVQQEAAPSVRPVAPAAPVVAAVPVTAPVQPAPRVETGPLGVWLTEEKEGKVRIEQCGVNLCGYSVNARSNQNGEKVLINMKPVNGSKWSGKIFDPKSGSTYDSTIAMKGTENLRVQGCAFGGMFCGGQTWSRAN